jgi:Arc/MetJ-type ribon-helix-helix transcriptional regulator
MQINLTPEQRDVVRYAVETGSVHDQEEAVQQAMALWMTRQRRRAEILARVDAAEASLARGEGIVITQEGVGSGYV